MIASKILAYSNLPSGPFFIFCILVLALSKGKEKKDAKNPETALALYRKNSILTKEKMSLL